MNVEELKSEALKTSLKSERVKFIMDYFFNTAQYDYVYLLANGYARGEIKHLSGILEPIRFGLDNPDISEFVLKRSIVSGRSQIIENMLQLRDESHGSYEEYKSKLINYIKEELKKHLDDDFVIDKNAERFMQKIEEDLKRKKNPYQMDNGEVRLLNYDISAVLLDYMIEPDIEMPPKIQDGLIVRGVCEHFSKNIVPILKSLDIETYEIGGISELDHSWILVKTEEGYRSVDLTRALFIKDSFRGIPKEQTAEEWLYTDLRKMFELQPTRQIIEIDDVRLQERITAENYTPELFESIMERGFATRSLKENMKEYLRDGVTDKDCENAQNIENEKEEKGYDE